MSSSSLLRTLCLVAFLVQASVVTAAFDSHDSHFAKVHKRANAGPKCDISTAQLAIPGVGDVDPVAGEVLQWMALGVGSVQYTCTANGSWQQQGSRGTLYDASCAYDPLSEAFLALTTDALKVLPGKSVSVLTSALTKLSGKTMSPLGTFYLHDDAQKFDLRKRRGGPLDNDGDKGYVVTKLDASQDAPVSSYDVPWERMTGTMGQLAHSVFRVSTAGGMPYDPKCSPGQTDSVPFAAQFWFYSKSAGKKVVEGEVLGGILDAPKHCEITPPRKEKERELSVMVNSVIYGDSMEECTSTDDCSAKCLADDKCEGFILSTEDGEGHTKYGVNSNEIIYSPVFTSGVVRAVTGSEYIDRFGFVESCPVGQITGPHAQGCIVPLCL